MYDVTRNQKYLQMAITIFKDMTGGWGAPTCGGLLWEKGKQFNSAIANELLLSVSAKIANRVDASQQQPYLDWALKEWDWFSRSGLINAQHMVDDNLAESNNCQPVGAVFTYNQGVILGGLVAVLIATSNTTYLTTAKAIASAVISQHVDSNGILHEDCDPNYGITYVQFKGVFMRGLQRLQAISPEYKFKELIEKNANSIWQTARNPEYKIGSAWNSPFNTGSVQAQSSALDCLVAAAAVLSS